MITQAQAPAPAAVGSVGLNIGIFLLFVLVTLYFVYRASRTNKTASDYYAAGRSFTGPQNGVAISGDYLSAASFLGIAGAIALNGYDGFLYSIGFLVAWLVALLLVAELLRNTGKYTMGDVLAFRMRQRPVRAAAASSTLVVSFFYLLAQMAGAGGLIALLLQIPTSNRFGQGAVIAVVGALMIVYVLVGGMKGTTYVQIIKAVLLILGAGAMTLWVLGLVGFNLSALLGDAAAASPRGEAVLAPGLQYTNPIDFVSLGLALVLGTAGLPHILMRFYTVPSSKEARRSVVWAIWLIGLFYLFTLVLGYGAAALLPPGTITSANQNNAAPLLAYHLGGELMLGLIAAVAFATILAVVAGLTITASASFAHDLYANVIKRGETSPDAEVRVARITALVIGVLAIAGGIIASGQNIAFLVALAFAVAASANLPTILYSLFWKKFNTTGALFSIYGGLAICIILIVFSPAVSGKPVNPATGRSASMIQGVDFHWFPLDNPGLVSIPASFLLGVIGTYVGGRRPVEEGKFAEMEVRSLTGAGAEKASSDHGIGVASAEAATDGSAAELPVTAQPEDGEVRSLSGAGAEKAGSSGSDDGAGASGDEAGADDGGADGAGDDGIVELPVTAGPTDLEARVAALEAQMRALAEKASSDHGEVPSPNGAGAEKTGSDDSAGASGDVAVADDGAVKLPVTAEPNDLEAIVDALEAQVRALAEVVRRSDDRNPDTIAS